MDSNVEKSFRIDMTKIGLEIQDSDKSNTEADKEQLWLFVVIDTTSRQAVSWGLSYKQPDRDEIKALLDEILPQIRNVPHEILIDASLVSHQLRATAQRDGVNLRIQREHPMSGDRVEQFFGLLNQVLSTLPSRINRQTNSETKGLLTSEELEQKVKEYIAIYNTKNAKQPAPGSTENA